MTEATHATRRIVLPPDLNHLALLGRNDEHLRSLEARYDVRITVRGHDVTLRGEERQVSEAERVLRYFTPDAVEAQARREWDARYGELFDARNPVAGGAGEGEAGLRGSFTTRSG